MRSGQHDLNELKQKITDMSQLCAQTLGMAIRAHRERHTLLAKMAMADDARINGLELEIDGLAFDLLASQEGLAERDLRWLFGMLHINMNLEGIGDEAYRIARHTMFLNLRPALPSFAAVDDLQDRVMNVFAETSVIILDSDPEVALEVGQRAAATAFLGDEVATLLMRNIAENRHVAYCCIHLILLVRSLKHVAELSSDIAAAVHRIHAT